jgi:hypothetical protein
MEAQFRCVKCEKLYPLEEVYRERMSRGVLRQYCEECVVHPQWNPSRADYLKALEEQSHRCAICERELRLIMDYDRHTRVFRGLLCNACTTALRMFRYSLPTLTAALSYLQKADD